VAVDYFELVEGARTPALLRHIADLMEGRTGPYYGTVQPVITRFADRFGWVRVLQVIAGRDEVTL
jgi:hypothetical protein